MSKPKCGKFDRVMKQADQAKTLQGYLDGCWHAYSLLHPTFRNGAFVGIFSIEHWRIDANKCEYCDSTRTHQYPRTGDMWLCYACASEVL